MSTSSRWAAVTVVALLLLIGLWMPGPTHPISSQDEKSGSVTAAGVSNPVSPVTSPAQRSSATTTMTAAAPPPDALPTEDFWPSGQMRSRGIWLGGLRYGEHRTWYDNGQIHSIDTWNGDQQRNGRSVVYDEGGTLISDGRYELGYRIGEWRTYYASGQLESLGNWEPVDPQDRCRGQRRVGYWQFFWPDGQVDQDRSGLYVMGERVP